MNDELEIESIEGVSAAGSLHRMRQLLALEEHGQFDTSDLRDDRDDDADLDADAVQVTAVETVVSAPSDPPVVTSEPPQLLPGQFVLIDKLCEKFNKPRGHVCKNEDEFFGLFLGVDGDEFARRVAKRKTRDDWRRRNGSLPVKQRRKSA